jgi:hypothetical protein
MGFRPMRSFTALSLHSQCAPTGGNFTQSAATPFENDFWIARNSPGTADCTLRVLDAGIAICTRDLLET